MDAVIWLAGLTIFAAGYLASHLDTRERIQKLKRNHARQIKALPTYEEGWVAALSDTFAVKNAHQYHFQNRP